jgi:hypothetical protein
MLQLAAKLGSKTPIIVSCTNGIIGRDAVTGEHKEVSTTVIIINIFTSLVFMRYERQNDLLSSSINLHAGYVGRFLG